MLPTVDRLRGTFDPPGCTHSYVPARVVSGPYDEHVSPSCPRLYERPRSYLNGSSGASAFSPRPRKAKNLGLRGYAVSKTDQPTWCTALVRADEKLMCALDHHLPAPREVEPSLKRKGANRPIWGF